MNRDDFFRIYESKLARLYEWAHDDKKRTRYMDSVRATVNDKQNTWICDPTAVALKLTWEVTGGKGTVSLKKLRELPA